MVWRRKNFTDPLNDKLHRKPMFNKYLRSLRTVLAIMFFLMTVGIFTDVYHMLSREAVDSVLYMQFVPSMIRFTTACTLASAGFILVSVLTLLFGRVYCSTVCPLGILMDLVIGIKNRIRKFRKIPLKKSPLVQYYADHKSISMGFSPKHNVKISSLIKYFILFLFILAIIFKSNLLIGLLDPFSLTGKIIVNLFRPIFLMGSNELLVTGDPPGTPLVMKPAAISMESLSLVVFLLAVLLIMIFLSWFKDRWYCNVICPVGTLLGVISKFSIFRLRVNFSGCTHCGACVQVCKAGCIHPDTYHIEMDRCVVCYDCIDVCTEGGAEVKIMDPGLVISGLKINVRQERNSNGSQMSSGSGSIINKECEWVPGPRLSQTEAGSGGLSRRRFIGTFLMGFSGMLYTHHSLSGNPGTTNNLTGEEAKETLWDVPVTPPGSQGITRFTESCTSCHLCVSACPSGVLKPAFLEYGLQGIFQPRMDFHSGYCLSDCIRCSEICPTDAIHLMDLNIKKRLKIGSSVFIRNLCLVQTERRLCGLCANVCGEKAIRLVPWLGNLVIPEIDDLKCNGCGACELVCPVRPYRAIVVDALTEHQLLK